MALEFFFPLLDSPPYELYNCSKELKVNEANNYLKALIMFKVISSIYFIFIV